MSDRCGKISQSNRLSFKIDSNYLADVLLSETQSVKYDDPQFNTFDLFSHFLFNIIIWALGDPSVMEVETRKAIANIDPNLVVYRIEAYSIILAGDFQQQNMIDTFTMLFGALGLVLAAVGLYGILRVLEVAQP